MRIYALPLPNSVHSVFGFLATSVPLGEVFFFFLIFVLRLLEVLPYDLFLLLSVVSSSFKHAITSPLNPFLSSMHHTLSSGELSFPLHFHATETLSPLSTP